METYVDIYLPASGEKISIINKILLEVGLKPTLGEHDYVYNWKKILTIEDELIFIDNIQEKLKNTGAILRFKTIR